MLPNRQEEVAEDNWMYRQLQAVTVLPVSKWQGNIGGLHRMAEQENDAVPMNPTHGCQG